MSKKVDIIDVMIAVRKGDLKIVTKNGYYFLKDTKSGECVMLNEANVLCKVCTHAEKDGIHQFSLRCTRFNTGEFTHRVRPGDFCSYGERRADNV